MRRRILLTIVGVAALAVGAFFVPAALAVRSRIQRSDLLELQREAAIVAARFPPVGPIDLGSIEASVERGHDLGLYDRAGRLVDGEGPVLADRVVRTGTSGVFAEGEVDGDLVAAVPVRPTALGAEFVVRILEPREVGQRRVEESLAVLALAAVGVVGLAALIGALLARRLSRPLERLEDWATTLGRDVHGEPPPPSGIAELDELQASLTGADGRIRDLLQRERSFSSHVAHQLRTPVTAMRVAVEAELDDPRPDAADVLHESLGALDRLESTITSLLALGRDDARQPVSCDVVALVCDQAARWEPSFAAAGREVTVHGGVVAANVDPAAVRHVLDVLLDNALRHGHGPVHVDAVLAGDEVHVDVVDQGQARLHADPFSERPSAASHGIGLRLARTLAESEGGGIELVPAPTTRFRLLLPRTR